jgi:hypothetical protein
MISASFPIGCEVVLSFFERDLASADTAHGLDLNAVLAIGFFPRLQLEVRRVCRAAAEAERDDMIKLVLGSIEPALAARLRAYRSCR